MEITEQNLEALATYLRKTLSPNSNERSEAEKALQQIERNENYSSLLLTLCERSTTPDEIRLASVITFKNFIKRNWPSIDESNSISLKDRNHIKEYIIDLMIRSPEHIQEQLSDAIIVIGKCDFPDQWSTLLDTMIKQFQQQSNNSFQSINGVLKTAHLLFERYRSEQKSDELWLEIKLVLEKFTPAFTELFKSLMIYYPQKESDPIEMKNIFNSLYLIIQIFYDLNAQELPEHFEDNITVYMTNFLTLLSYDHPKLHSTNNDPGVLDQVKTEICRSVALYANNYSDEFKPYAQQFALTIWSLLTKLDLSSSYDELVSTAMKFLSALAARSHHCRMFEGGDTLKIVCEQVILPNLFLRESDVEEFEDNPEEYIRKDIEKSDSATRRRAACDFLQALCIFFESQVIAIYSQYIDAMQKEYLQNPTQNWLKKDTCIFLVLALASKGETQKVNQEKSSIFIFNSNFF
jgi:exportin-2 (importin alpha re-exporter)